MEILFRKEARTSYDTFIKLNLLCKIYVSVVVTRRTFCSKLTLCLFYTLLPSSLIGHTFPLLEIKNFHFNYNPNYNIVKYGENYGGKPQLLQTLTTDHKVPLFRSFCYSLFIIHRVLDHCLVFQKMYYTIEIF